MPITASGNHSIHLSSYKLEVFSFLVLFFILIVAFLIPQRTYQHADCRDYHSGYNHSQIWGIQFVKSNVVCPASFYLCIYGFISSFMLLIVCSRISASVLVVVV